MYECHITVEKPEPGLRVTYEALAEKWGWKTSCIDGDPVLGRQVFFYFSAHDGDFLELMNRMEHLAACLGEEVVIRKKIEHIVYDTKTGIGV